jgi:hypothetical protein
MVKLADCQPGDKITVEFTVDPCDVSMLGGHLTTTSGNRLYASQEVTGTLMVLSRTPAPKKIEVGCTVTSTVYSSVSAKVLGIVVYEDQTYLTIKWVNSGSIITSPIQNFKRVD